MKYNDVLKYFILSLVVFLTPTFCFSQDIEMADVMRSNGKIYVVVAIVAVIIIGLLAYVITLDRKVSRLENKLDKNQK